MVLVIDLHSRASKIPNLKLFIKYMVSNRCKLAVKEELKKLGLHFIVVGLGEVEIMEDLTVEQQQRVLFHQDWNSWTINGRF